MLEKESNSPCQTRCWQEDEFDRIAGASVKALKVRYADIAIPYHPAIRSLELPEGFDGTFYPSLENVPPRYAIVRANRYMLEISDVIICINVNERYRF